MLDTLFIASAYAQEVGESSSAPSPIGGLIPLVFIMVVFYFLLIRPQQKKYKQHQQMISNVERNDKVITAGGIHGRVTKIGDDNTVTVQIAEGVEVIVEKGTLSSVLTKTGEPKAPSGADPKNKKDQKAA